MPIAFKEIDPVEYDIELYEDGVLAFYVTEPFEVDDVYYDPDAVTHEIRMMFELFYDGAAGYYEPLSYEDGDICEACWLDDGIIHGVHEVCGPNYVVYGPIIDEAFGAGLEHQICKGLGD